MPYVRAANQYESLSKIWSETIPFDGNSSTINATSESAGDISPFSQHSVNARVDDDYHAFTQQSDFRFVAKPNRPPFYPTNAHHTHSDLEDFFQAHNLHEFLPVTRMSLRRGGFLVDGYTRVTTVAELARIDPD